MFKVFVRQPVPASQHEVGPQRPFLAKARLLVKERLSVKERRLLADTDGSLRRQLQTKEDNRLL